jgi:hypothetical protein
MTVAGDSRRTHWRKKSRRLCRLTGKTFLYPIRLNCVRDSKLSTLRTVFDLGGLHKWRTRTLQRRISRADCTGEQQRWRGNEGTLGPAQGCRHPCLRGGAHISWAMTSTAASSLPCFVNPQIEGGQRPHSRDYKAIGGGVVALSISHVRPYGGLFESKQSDAECVNSQRFWASFCLALPHRVQI